VISPVGQAVDANDEDATGTSIRKYSKLISRQNSILYSEQSEEGCSSSFVLGVTRYMNRRYEKRCTWLTQLTWRFLDRSLFHNHIINPALDMITGKRDMYGTLRVTEFAKISAVFGPAVMHRDDSFGNLVRFEFFIITLTLFCFSVADFLFLPSNFCLHQFQNILTAF